MNDCLPLEPSRAASIQDRLEKALAFARDVLETPELLDDLPDGATLVFRDVHYLGQEVHLTAYPLQLRSGWWTARITGPGALAVKSLELNPPVGSNESNGKGGKWGSSPTSPETAPTAERALDALQEKLSDADRVAWSGESTDGMNYS